MPLQPGQTLGNDQYRVDVEDPILGRGGFGLVYRAYDTLIHKWVAIKELDPRLLNDEQWLKRFRIEARATMELTHPHIARTHNVFTEGGNYYIVMEYLQGGSLQERLPEGQPLPIDEALRITDQVCQGLEYAHGQGIVHNDLKPANILFDAQGRAKVADFGVAHVGEGMITRSWSTASGTMAGTLPYMSPEQTEGVRDDPRTDVYALGAIMYRLFTGQAYLDFDDRPTPAAVAANVRLIQEVPPLPPNSHNPRLPDWIDGLILKALAKVPSGRFQSAEQLRQALGVRQPDPKAKRQNRTLWLAWLVGGIAALLALVIIAALAFLLMGGDGGGRTLPAAGPIVILGTATQADPATDSLAPTTAPEATIPPPASATPEPPTPVPSPTLPPPTATTGPPPLPVPDLFHEGLWIHEQAIGDSYQGDQQRVLVSIEGIRIVSQRMRQGAWQDPETSILDAGHYIGNDGSAPWLPRAVYDSLSAGGSPPFRATHDEAPAVLTLEGYGAYPLFIDGAPVDVPVRIALSPNGDRYTVLNDPSNPYVLRYDGGPAAGGYVRYVEAFDTPSEPAPGPVVDDRIFVVVYRLSDGVSLRSSPGTGYPKITDFYAGSRVKALGPPVWGPEDRVWWPVSTTSGEGWMAEQSNNWRLLKPVIEAGDSLEVINAQGSGDLSLRDSACERIDVLSRGQQILVSAGPDDLCDEPGSTISQDGRAWWYVLVPDGPEGWVADFASTADRRMLVAPHWYADLLAQIGPP